MNLRDLIILTNDLIPHMGGSFRGTPEGEDTVKMLNRALRTIGRKLKIYDPAVKLTLTDGQPIYQLDSPALSKVVWRLDQILIDGTPLMDAAGSDGGVWSIAELDARVPQWRKNTTKSVPTTAVDYGSNRLLLYPIPNSTTAAQTTHFVSGHVLPGVHLTTGEYGRLGFGLVDKADLPTGYGEPIPGGGPQPTWTGAGGGVSGNHLPPGVTVYTDPPAGGGGSGTGGFGEPGGETGGGGGLHEHQVEETEVVIPASVPSGPPQGGTSVLVWDLTAEPDIVIDLHEFLAYWSAWKFAEPMLSDEVAFIKVAKMNTEWAALIKEVASGYEARQTAWGAADYGTSRIDWRLRY